MLVLKWNFNQFSSVWYIHFQSANRYIQHHEYNSRLDLQYRIMMW